MTSNWESVRETIFASWTGWGKRGVEHLNNDDRHWNCLNRCTKKKSSQTRIIKQNTFIHNLCLWRQCAAECDDKLFVVSVFFFSFFLKISKKHWEVAGASCFKPFFTIVTVYSQHKQLNQGKWLIKLPKRQLPYMMWHSYTVHVSIKQINWTLL